MNPRVVNKSRPIDYLSAQKDFSMLSLPDLLKARDYYHDFLIDRPHVVATALGRYLIRKDEPPPDMNERAQSRVSGNKPPRTLGNSEVRRYSWPCVLVLVDQWIEPDDFKSGKANPADMIPKSLQLPDGDQVPVCTVLAQGLPANPEARVAFTHRLIGGGMPLVADVQGRQYVASVGCLVTDGHTTYALTNRHVTGPEGTPVYAWLGGRTVQIGRSSSLQLSRKLFEEIWPPLIGKSVYVDLDIGLVEIDDVNCWTAQVFGIGEIGSLADVSGRNVSLRLIGAPVRAYGAASGLMKGMVHGLFYRYKALRGFEYVSDFLIGPRSEDEPFPTRHGDSGTIWLIETGDEQDNLRPLAVQWGGQAFPDKDGKPGQAYALATALSTVCDRLNVEVVRDFNVGMTQYWGSVGHYTIGEKACDLLANKNLSKLMKADLDRISYKPESIIQDKPIPTWHDFVPLADVADIVWKRFPSDPSPYFRHDENPNHFADMDRKRPDNHQTLLEICHDHPENVSVAVWQEYYKAIGNNEPGLLPFRTWQIYQSMVDFVQQGDVNSFVCAAGILAHYVGDACQPLHISYMYNGDPDRATAGKAYGDGVHSDYETKMVNNHIYDIFTGLNAMPHHHLPAKVKGGHAAAVALVKLMAQTFGLIAPLDIVNKYVELKTEYRHQRGAADKVLEGLWDAFGDGTVKVMMGGCTTLALLWESAWAEGKGDATINKLDGIDPGALQTLYQNRDFLPSHTMATIGDVLKA